MRKEEKSITITAMFQFSGKSLTTLAASNHEDNIMEKIAKFHHNLDVAIVKPHLLDFQSIPSPPLSGDWSECPLIFK